MDSSFTEKYLHSLSPKLYSFAYALIPDDLQAQQIVLDAYSLLFIKNLDLDEKDSILSLLLAHIYLLGKKRAVQLEGSVTTNSSQFYTLNVTERAVLFLRHHFDLDYSKIAPILDMSATQIGPIASYARGKIMQALGMVDEMELLSE